jgi:hypothetical protein
MQETIINDLKEVGIKSISMDMYDINTVQRTGIKMTFEEEAFSGLIVNIINSSEHKMMTNVKGNNILWCMGSGYFKMTTAKAFAIFAKHLLGR